MKKAIFLLTLLVAAEVVAQCCGHWQRLTGGNQVLSPPCVAFSCYEGDGMATQHIDTSAQCAPFDALWIKRKDDDLSAQGVVRIAAMGANNSLPAAPGSTTFFGNAIVGFDNTGFTVGNDFEVNQIDVTYCYYAFAAADGFFTVGSYGGDGTNPRELSLPFMPDVMALIGTGPGTDKGFRIKTRELTGDQTLQMDAVNLFDVLTGEMTGFKDIALGDSFTGVTLGANANLGTNTYYYMAWNIVDPATWVFTGTLTANGSLGDGTILVANTPCASVTRFVMTSADTGGVPASPARPARYYRHNGVQPDTTNYAQRFNGTDIFAEPPGGDDGGFRELNAGNFILGNGTTITGHQPNITPSVIYYWGICQ